MKRFLLFVFLFSMFASGDNKIPGWSITDIYKMAQQATISNLDYPLYYQRLEKEKWVSITPAWNTFIDATVDGKNSYIYILDEGTGGGSFSTQAALWRNDAGALVLVIAENTYDEIFPERSFLKAFQYTPVSADSISQDIRLVSPPMPKLTLLDFATEGMSARDLHMMKKVRSTIFYKLPRNGTSIHALLIIEDELKDQSILKECYYDKKTCEEKRKAYRYYYQKLKGKIYRDIELKWQDYQFAIGKKSRKEPTIKDVWPENIKVTGEDL